MTINTLCVQLFGLFLDVLGVGLFSWSEVAGMARILARERRLNPNFGQTLREEPWYRRIPFLLRSQRRPVDVRTLDDPIMDVFPLKFWGLVLIALRSEERRVGKEC